MLSRTSQSADRNLAHVTGELKDIRDVLDNTISAAAPEYRNYMKNYADASKEIDWKQALQDSENGLNQLKTLTPFQRMMRTIVEARQSPGNNPYKNIPDETMAQLWNLRDDLRRSATANDLARAKGSDTMQNLIDFAANAAKTGGRAAAHYGLFHMTGDLGANAILGALDYANMNRAKQKNINRAREMLNPNPLQYPLPEP